MSNTQVQNINDDFKFYVPVEFDLIKGKKENNEDGEWTIKGIASTDSEDSAGEMLSQEGFDLSQFNWLNWNHSGNANGIVGEPTKAQVTPKGLYIEGFLYKDLPQAQHVWQLGKALSKSKRGNKLRLSVEGKVLERDPTNPKKILKSRITACAICPTPVNGDTWVDFIKKGYTDNEKPSYDQDIKQKEPDVQKSNKSNGGNEEYILDITDEHGNRITVSKNFEIKIDKSLAATGNGAVITKESLDSDIKDNKKRKKLTKSFFIQNKSDKFNQNLSKSDVYDYIFNNVDDITIDSAKQLYIVIESIQKSQNLTMAELTEEKLQKAFNTLKILSEQTDELEKGMKMPDEKTQGGKSDVLEKMVSIMKGYMDKDDKMSKSDIFKAMKEKEGYSDEDDDDMEKAYGMATATDNRDIKDSELQKSEKDKETKRGRQPQEEGDTEEDHKKDKMKKSIDDEIAKAEKALEDLKAKKQEEISKSEGEGDDLNKSEPTNDTSKIEELIKGMQADFSEKFSALGEINKELLSQNEEWKNKFFKSEQAKEELEQKSQGRKSITTQSYLEKSQGSDLNKEQVLSISKNKDQILAKSDTMIDYEGDSIRKGQGDDFRFANAMAKFESGNMSSNDIAFIASKFQEKGIKLVD